MYATTTLWYPAVKEVYESSLIFHYTHEIILQCYTFDLLLLILHYLFTRLFCSAKALFNPNCRFEHVCPGVSQRTTKGRSATSAKQRRSRPTEGSSFTACGANHQLTSATDKLEVPNNLIVVS